MKSEPIGRYIYLGGAVVYLREAKEGWRVHGDGFILYNLDGVLRCLEQFGLPVTLRAAQELIRFRDELADTEDDRELTDAEALRLKETADDLQKTLLSEAEDNIAFIVDDKRMDVNKLLHDVRALMAPGVFDSLPDIAQYDLMEAGKCIAFERPTASAFHLLRATESMLRHFYCSIVKRNRGEMMWGPMVRSLRQRKKRPPPKPLLDNLDNIRLSFRNPTQHPEKVYDIHEVQDLFALCVDVLNRMVTFLARPPKHHTHPQETPPK